jgi:hypothetical protein
MDYVISGLLVIFILGTLFVLKRAERRRQQ